MSADPRKKLEEEIQALERELRDELPKALKTAAALGDLEHHHRVGRRRTTSRRFAREFGGIGWVARSGRLAEG